MAEAPAVTLNRKFNCAKPQSSSPAVIRTRLGGGVADCRRALNGAWLCSLVASHGCKVFVSSRLLWSRLMLGRWRQLAAARLAK
jgi:hypothetical protein